MNADNPTHIILSKDQLKLLGKTALWARERSYSPYSHFAVGAALMTCEGSIYQGCNIENAAYTPSNCAERTAFFKAVSEGERHFSAIAIAGGKAGTIPESFCAPCGVCRQVMMEFCKPEDFQIILVKNHGESESDYRIYTLAELMPEGFGPDNLA